MPTHFKTYALSREQHLPPVPVLCIVRVRAQSPQHCAMPKTSNKVQLHKQAKAIHLEIQHLKSFVNAILRS